MAEALPGFVRAGRPRSQVMSTPPPRSSVESPEFRSRMKRRQFLQTHAAGLPTAPASPTASGPGTQQARRDPTGLPRVFLFNDGRHAGGLDSFEPPVTAEDHVFIADQLAGSGVDALVLFAGGAHGTVLYPSRVADLWGATVKRWNHYVWARTGRVLRQLIADGHDPLKLLCDQCHSNGLLMIASAWISLHGASRETHENLGRWSSFALDHPQFQVGEDPDPRGAGIMKTRFSLLHAEVREERFRLLSEMLSDYETDGVELNLTFAMPYCRFSEVDRLVSLLTQWLRDLRLVADRAQNLQKRPKHIYARIPAHPEAWRMVGYEVETWISEKLVDGLFCESSYTEEEGVDQDVDLAPVVALTRGTRCRVYYAFHTNLFRQFARSATPAMIWAAAANAYDQGVDGFAIADHVWTPNGWPWTPREYETLRLLGHPELLAHADKHYLVRSDIREEASVGWLPGRSTQLPKELAPGELCGVSFRVADDLDRRHGLGRLKSVVLRVRFGDIIPNYDRVAVEFNGQKLPEAILEKVDMTYRLVDQRSTAHSITPYGYAYDYHLSPTHFPKKGRNFLTVKLLKRDPNISGNLSVERVDCRIEYRRHRHFEARPIQY